jgi:predicted GNAT family N-acyltransferase
MTVERAQPGDMQEILDLQKRAYMSEAEINNDFSIPPLTQTIEEMYEDYRNQTIIKVVDDGKIIASARAFMKEGVCHIGRVIVEPSMQNRGIGKVVLAAIEECFSDCTKYALFTGKKSARNLHFYAKAGYRIVGEDFLGPNVCIVNMEKENRRVGAPD